MSHELIKQRLQYYKPSYLHIFPTPFLCNYRASTEDSETWETHPTCTLSLYTFFPRSIDTSTGVIKYSKDVSPCHTLYIK